MTRIIAALALSAAMLAPTALLGQDAQPKAKPAAAAPKIGKNQKVCSYKFPGDAKSTTWVCEKEQPCCAWDAIRYVKCGSTITNCL